jgi:hypothetical protein
MPIHVGDPPDVDRNSPPPVCIHPRTMPPPALRSLTALIVVALASACGHAPPPVRRASVAMALPRAVPMAGWSYEVAASPRGEVLAVEAVFPPGTGTELSVAEGAEPFIRKVLVHEGDRRTAIAAARERWSIPACAAGCRLSYEVALGEAARAHQERSVARTHAGGAALEAPPSSWLLRPLEAPAGIPFRFHVTSAPDDAFASGVFAVAGVADTYEGQSGGGFDLPYAAFGRIRRLEVAQGHVEVALFPGALRDEPAVIAWVDRSARVVEAFYGGFPIPRVLVLVQPTPGTSRVGFGTTMGSSGAAIEVPVGENVTPEALRDDWMLVHEMVHTALPDLTRKHHWLEEGLATYVEPLARAHAGLVTPDQVWRDWIIGMPQGEPEAGDDGLDRTRTWGRTYWGGALFCLAADVEIRERTANRRSLVDAVRAIVAHGGNISVSWSIEKVLEVGDAATGVPVLRETYARMATRPEAVDLRRLWSRLGVRLERGKVIYDDAAPLASVRRAMTQPP